MRNLLSDRSFRTKTCSQDSEKTVLIVPDTLSSDGPLDKPSTSRSLSLNKILFPSATKAAHSLPVTPIAISDADNVNGSHAEGDSDLNVCFCCFRYCFVKFLIHFLVFIHENMILKYGALMNIFFVYRK